MMTMTTMMRGVCVNNDEGCVCEPGGSKDFQFFQQIISRLFQIDKS